MDHGSLVLDCDAPGVWQDKQAQLLPTRAKPCETTDKGAQELESPPNVVADGKTIFLWLSSIPLWRGQ